MKPLKLGKKGYFGEFNSPEKNEKVLEINKLIDEYNSSINSFDTMEEQFQFLNTINNKISNIIKEL